MFTLLVCGGRDYGDLDSLTRDDPRWPSREAEYKHVMNVLGLVAYCGAEPEQPLPLNLKLIAGAARGADTAAVDWAVVNWLPFQEFPADWKKHGKGAGHIRNKQQLDEGKPHLCIAFPGGAGTENMIKQARAAGVPVLRVEP